MAQLLILQSQLAGERESCPIRKPKPPKTFLLGLAFPAGTECDLLMHDTQRPTHSAQTRGSWKPGAVDCAADSSLRRSFGSRRFARTTAEAEAESEPQTQVLRACASGGIILAFLAISALHFFSSPLCVGSETPLRQSVGQSVSFGAAFAFGFGFSLAQSPPKSKSKSKSLPKPKPPLCPGEPAA
ncbi:uncharacterized protein LOC127011512 [Drosophila biarmipes]|uniref:uncharacterized protein LOC127011512 n=1 Tax=Drosophila biarmipes TaxID=125945 RepID=UPI0021CCBC1E|nr:uncharacterized protein LOC127011512 [Drosophila biarmipes]